MTEQLTEVNRVKGWQPYDLDYYARKLVLEHRDRKDVTNESHKMRMSVAYGLERFWGEHLRLGRDKPEKGRYWKAVWETLAEILAKADLILPNDNVRLENTAQIKDMAKKIWSMPPEQQRVALAILTQLCEALVWWHQRYKVESSDNSDN